eukprot:TRINITY_DN3161_c0_g1_i1.p1 TRINITY_DN3161_c0_g1~~TRINITY_DN3161_c0_g1_i1.p1  ORF type:complete len:261 (-),score=79.26 TRINITY_DN3161_c0_g1_i1:141-923(-)
MQATASTTADRENVLDQLGPRWQAMCRASASTTFLWSHNGKVKNGWVQLLPGGNLSTTWCLGAWQVLGNNPDVVEMIFGSSRHLCHYREGGFVVEQKYGIRTGRESYKPGAPKSQGWISASDDRGHRGVPGERGYKAVGQPGKRKDLSDDEAEARSSSFSQKDLQFDAFFGAWSDWKSKRARLLAQAPKWTQPSTSEAPQAATFPAELAAEAALAAADAAAEAAELAAEAADEAAKAIEEATAKAGAAAEAAAAEASSLP